MSRSSFLASSLEAEFKVLNPVNDAMINLKLSNFGRASELDLNLEDILKSRKVLLEFVDEILQWLSSRRGSSIFYFVYEILLTGRKSPNVWKKTLLKLKETLQSDGEVSHEELESLEELLSQIDTRISSKMAQLNIR